MKLQWDPELTLEKATAMARQHESVVKQQETVRGEQQKPPSIDAMESRKSGERKSKRPQNRSNKQFPPAGQTPPRQLQKQVCTRCGKTHLHGKQHCPAREAICHKCSKKGHYHSMCKTTNLAQIETQSDEEQFLGTLEQSPVTLTDNPWEVTLILNGVPVLFKIDTGADVSAISESVFKQLKDATLFHSDRHLSGPSQYQLQVSGKFTTTLKYGTKETKENIFVVQKLQKALLGRPGIVIEYHCQNKRSARREVCEDVSKSVQRFRNNSWRVLHKFARRSQAFCNLDPQKNTITPYAKSQTGA